MTGVKGTVFLLRSLALLNESISLDPFVSRISTAFPVSYNNIHSEISSRAVRLINFPSDSCLFEIFLQLFGSNKTIF